VLLSVVETVHQLALLVKGGRLGEILSSADTLADVAKSAGERERV